ncbi:MAG TPA: hypothetical protein VGE63_00430 [Candidatus Paceibacterota bacterium]
MNKTLKVILIVIIVIGVIAVANFFMKDSHRNEADPSKTTTTETKPEGAPVFAWSYTPSEKNEIPQSTISLTATYPNGAKQTKEIETIEGGCNEYPEPDKDVYKQSQMIICYYAGFGRYYKVVESNGAYLVQRKEFEEGSPEYNPPQQEFKTIAQF